MESHWSICMIVTIVAISMLFHSYPFCSSPKHQDLKTVAKASRDTFDEYLHTIMVGKLGSLPSDLSYSSVDKDRT